MNLLKLVAFLALVMGLVVQAQNVSNQERLEAMQSDLAIPPKNRTGTLMESLHNLPHQAFTSNDNEPKNSLLVPETATYGQTLGFIILIAAVIGVVLLIFGLVMHGASYCGDEKCRFTCGHDDNIFVKWSPLIFVCLWTLVVVVMLILSWTEENSINNSSTIVLDSLDSQYRPECARIMSIRAEIEDLGRTQAAQIVSPLVDLNETMTANVEDFVDVGGRSNLGRRIFVGVLGIIVLVTLALGILASIFRKAKFVKVVLVLGWVCVLFLWVSVGLHAALATGSADACYDVADLQVKIDALLFSGQYNLRVTNPAGGILDCMSESSYDNVNTNLDTLTRNVCGNPCTDPAFNAKVAHIKAELTDVYSCIWVAEVFMDNKYIACADLIGAAGNLATYSFIAMIFFLPWIMTLAIVWKRAHFDEAAGGKRKKHKDDGSI